MAKARVHQQHRHPHVWHVVCRPTATTMQSTTHCCQARPLRVIIHSRLGSKHSTHSTCTWCCTAPARQGSPCGASEWSGTRCHPTRTPQGQENRRASGARAHTHTHTHIRHAPQQQYTTYSVAKRLHRQNMQPAAAPVHGTPVQPACRPLLNTAGGQPPTPPGHMDLHHKRRNPPAPATPRHAQPTTTFVRSGRAQRTEQLLCLLILSEPPAPGTGPTSSPKRTRNPLGPAAAAHGASGKSACSHENCSGWWRGASRVRSPARRRHDRRKPSPAPRPHRMRLDCV